MKKIVLVIHMVILVSMFGCAPNTVIVTKRYLAQDQLSQALIDAGDSIEAFKEISYYLFLKGLEDENLKDNALNLLLFYVKDKHLFNRLINSDSVFLKVVGYALYNRKITDIYEDFLLKYIDSPDSRVRRVVWFGIKRKLTKKMVEEALNDPWKEVRREVIKFIPKVYTTKEAEEILIDIIRHDPDVMVKRLALRELLYISPAVGSSLLKELLDSKQLPAYVKINFIEVVASSTQKEKTLSALLQTILEKGIEEYCSVFGVISAKYLLQFKREKGVDYLKNSLRCKDPNLFFLLLSSIKGERVNELLPELKSLLRASIPLKRKIKIAEVISELTIPSKEIKNLFLKGLQSEDIFTKLLSLENIIRYFPEDTVGLKTMYEVLKMETPPSTLIGSMILSSGKIIDAKELIQFMRITEDPLLRLYIAVRLVNLD